MLGEKDFLGLQNLSFLFVVFFYRFYDGNGLMGWRYITHGSVFSAKGERCVCVLCFIYSA